jgi:hypothetical protein
MNENKNQICKTWNTATLNKIQWMNILYSELLTTCGTYSILFLNGLNTRATEYMPTQCRHDLSLWSSIIEVQLLQAHRTDPRLWGIFHTFLLVCLPAWPSQPVTMIHSAPQRRNFRSQHSLSLLLAVYVTMQCKEDTWENTYKYFSVF